MAFAGHTGVDLEVPAGGDAIRSALQRGTRRGLQVRESDLEHVFGRLAPAADSILHHRIGTPSWGFRFRVRIRTGRLLDENLRAARALVRRHAPHRRGCATTPSAPSRSFRQLKLDRDRSRHHAEAGDVLSRPEQGALHRAAGPRVAILREQGVNGQVEMAAAFTAPASRAVDVHMTDILSGRVSLSDFRGLAACGGFSYGDVLGAGEGWAKSILFNERPGPSSRSSSPGRGHLLARRVQRLPDDEQPALDHPRRRRTGRASCRTIRALRGALLSRCDREEPERAFRRHGRFGDPVAVAHGEGYAEFADAAARHAAATPGLVAARFVDNHHQPTERYPLNPNGSPFGITASRRRRPRDDHDAAPRARASAPFAMSWHPADWPEDSPWMRLFHNARSR
jgi:phosphoribosylformylglycinamidine synthase